MTDKPRKDLNRRDFLVTTVGATGFFVTGLGTRSRSLPAAVAVDRGRHIQLDRMRAS